MRWLPAPAICTLSYPNLVVVQLRLTRAKLAGSSCRLRHLPASSKSDEVGRLCRSRVLDDVYLRTGQRVHRTVVTVRAPAEGQDTLLLRVAKAGHPRGEQAHQHAPAAVPGRPATEASVGHILCLSGEIRAKAPERGTTRARCEWLETRHRVGDNGLDGAIVRPMEGPERVRAGLKVQLLVLQGPAQGRMEGLDAPIHLQPVLDALDPEDVHPVPGRLRREQVGGGFPRCGMEDSGDAQELLAALQHVEELAGVEAPAPVRGPVPLHALGAVAQPRLGLEPVLGHAVPPGAQHVLLGPRGAERGLQEAWQQVVLQQ
mmetsp:Transcript_107971/g.305310  ORF Transcript_107971/g.305310 Transcript_107971/m.305310 type:complete len:316 (-) Transcript_107971:1572-2519(-)